MENGYERHDLFPLIDAYWPAVAAALPLFLAGHNDRLQIACDALISFLNFTARWDERIALSQKAEAKAVAVGDYRNAGWRAYSAGTTHHRREQADAVLVCAGRAETYWHTARAGARERAAAIQLRGMGYQLKKDYPAAIAAYSEAVELDCSLSCESEDVANDLNTLAVAERLSGDLLAAERNLCEALRIARHLNDFEGVANYTSNLAGLALDRETWSVAESLAREALPLAEKIGRMELIAHNCHRLAVALLRQGKAPEARPYARRAADLCALLASPSLTAVRHTLAECEM